MAGLVQQLLLGTPAEATQVKRFTGEQENLQPLIIDKIKKYLEQNSSFGPIGEQAKRQYYEQGIPGIKSQFATGGASSAYQNALARGGSQLQSNLAALESNYNLEQQKLIPGLGKLAFEPQFETIYQPNKAGLVEEAALGFAPKVGEMGADLLQGGVNKLLDYLGLGGEGKGTGAVGKVAEKVGEKVGEKAVGAAGDFIAGAAPAVAGGVAGAAAAPAAGAAVAPAAGAAAPAAAGAGAGAWAGIKAGAAAIAPWAMAAIGAVGLGLWGAGLWKSIKKGNKKKKDRKKAQLADQAKRDAARKAKKDAAKAGGV